MTGPVLPVLGLGPGVIGGGPPQLGGGGPVAPDGLDVIRTHPRADGAIAVSLATDGAAGGSGSGRVLHDSGVIGQTSLQSRLRLGRLTHADVLDVGAAEDDVLVHLVSGGHRPVSGPVLGTE